MHTRITPRSSAISPHEGSTGVLVKLDPLEVSPLSRLSDVTTSIRPITGRRWLFPASSVRHPNSAPCGVTYLGEAGGRIYHVSFNQHRMGYPLDRIPRAMLGGCPAGNPLRRLRLLLRVRAPPCHHRRASGLIRADFFCPRRPWMPQSRLVATFSEFFSSRVVNE